MDVSCINVVGCLELLKMLSKLTDNHPAIKEALDSIMASAMELMSELSRIVQSDPAGFFKRNIGRVPVLGFAAAIVYACMGKKDMAVISAFQCTNATLQVIGTLGGAVLGPVGAAAGGATGALIGTWAESMGHTYVEDKSLAAKLLLKGTVTDYLVNMSLAAVLGGVASYISRPSVSLAVASAVAELGAVGSSVVKIITNPSTVRAILIAIQVGISAAKSELMLSWHLKKLKTLHGLLEISVQEVENAKTSAEKKAALERAEQQMTEVDQTNEKISALRSRITQAASSTST